MGSAEFERNTSSPHPSSPYELVERAIEAARADTTARVTKFLQQNSLRYIIALIGDSSIQDTDVESRASIISDFLSNLESREQYAIQTGGTTGVVSELGIKLAREHSMATIGVYPGAASRYALDQPADLVIETPDLLYGRTSFGSETATFVNLIDGAVIIGGSYGTLVEASTILRTNKSRMDAIRNHPDNTSLPGPIYLCPVAGTGRVADQLVGVPIYENVGDCFPSPRDGVATGTQAAAFINSKLPPAQ